MQDPLKEIDKVLFECALDLRDPDLRNAFLERCCKGEPDSRTRLEHLLAVHSWADEFFDMNVLRAVSAESREEIEAFPLDEPEAGPKEDGLVYANARVGRYRLLRRLGEGGCGVVYAAEQEQPVQRQVALKIIRLGMDTERVIARFDVERRALALMSHPNIARVLDAGTTKTGRPYFVMELVPGIKITQFCDEHRLNIEKRSQLFLQVCMAIQHAHQKGVLHLDIKPSNVLIADDDGEPVPKVIDFGIGKAIEGPIADGSDSMGNDQFIGTPAYMSPEQAAGAEADIDTQSDIYSLGALLYELLVGHPPFDAEKLMELGIEGMRRTLREQEPPLPSVLLQSLPEKELAVVGEQRGCKASELIATSRNQLDWIVKRAMEKDPQRRYSTTNELAADIRRYLRNLPISARPADRIYAFRMFVRRNRIAFFSAAAIAMTLIGGMSTSTWLFFREREARRQEERLRAEAEDGEKLSRAVFLTREGDFEEADKLLKEIKTPLTRSSLDGVSTYRTMGNELGEQGRWQEASDHFAVLLRINGLDVWRRVAVDYQCYATVLMESGDVDGYSRFRDMALARYAVLFAGQPEPTILKSCLLAPLDKKQIAQIRPLAEKTGEWLQGLQPRMVTGWLVIPCSLWLYRTGDYQGAIDLAGSKFVESDTQSAQSATLRLIISMAYARMGRIDKARPAVAVARSEIEAKLGSAASVGDNRLGYWYDWALADVLLREASTLEGR